MDDLDYNEEVVKHGLKYYIFDWDDNILHMPTKILLERKETDGSWTPHEVSTSTFALIRNDTEHYRPPEGDWEKAFVNFRDFDDQPESQFLQDTKIALRGIKEDPAKAGPSFEVFKKALIEGRMFGIVTARGHNAHTLRKAVEYFIEHHLEDLERQKMLANLKGFLMVFNEEEKLGWSEEDILQYYLDLNRYHAVTSPAFQRNMNLRVPGSESPEEAKQVAIEDFVEYVIGLITTKNIDKPISIGFSDDDIGNVKAIENYIIYNLGLKFPQVKFVVYDTSEKQLPKGKKIVLQGQLELPF